LKWKESRRTRRAGSGLTTGTAVGMLGATARARLLPCSTMRSVSFARIATFVGCHSLSIMADFLAANKL
jgi:hypothetical protein